MSITDELRKWGYGFCGDTHDVVTAIADRIDAEHEAMLVDARKTVYQGYIELPKDADGEYIHAGDVLDGYGKTIEVVEMRYGRGGWVLISRDGSGYADTFAFAHRHAPTVEDVLREMLDAWGELPSNATNEAIVAEFAAKLRLAGENA